MPLSEDEEEVREDLPSDNEDNDEFYEHLLMQELEAEEQVLDGKKMIPAYWSNRFPSSSTRVLLSSKTPRRVEILLLWTSSLIFWKALEVKKSVPSKRNGRLESKRTRRTKSKVARMTTMKMATSSSLMMLKTVLAAKRKMRAISTSPLSTTPILTDVDMVLEAYHFPVCSQGWRLL